MTTASLLLVILAVGVGVAVRFDLSRRDIPLSIGLLTAGVALAVRAGDGGLGEFDGGGLLSGLLGAGLLLLVFGAGGALSKGLGKGEVVLLGGVGAAFGFQGAVAAAVFIALAGALQALVAVAWKRDAPALFHGRMTAGAPARQIPYAVAIAVGCVVTAWWVLSGQ